MDYEVSESECAFPGQAFINKPERPYGAQLFYARPGAQFLCLKNAAGDSEDSVRL